MLDEENRVLYTYNTGDKGRYRVTLETNDCSDRVYLRVRDNQAGRIKRAIIGDEKLVLIGGNFFFSGPEKSRFEAFSPEGMTCRENGRKTLIEVVAKERCSTHSNSGGGCSDTHFRTRLTYALKRGTLSIKLLDRTSEPIPATA
ncbi:MAG: hypothetical protein JSW08_03045 [archaeon]|nr:MAG: hypothetical protein JSW08_03045 [archaeon]